MSRQPDTSVPYFYGHSHHVYSKRHDLCSLDVFLPKVQSGIGRYWLIYLHGGAWRDPDIDSMSIVPALHRLSPTENDIRGVASIHYGLSPYPDHPRKPSSGEDPARNNEHPQHISDVLTALRWLQDKYGFGSDYVLAGHSCGATLTFQTLTKSLGSIQSAAPEIARLPVLPLAVVGLAGIYDMKLLVQDHENPVYRNFVAGAFGKNEAVWKIASPADWAYSALWPEGRVAILMQSDSDELVNWKQTETMAALLKRESTHRRRDLVMKGSGQHDDAWLTGHDLARALLQALTMLRDGE